MTDGGFQGLRPVLVILDELPDWLRRQIEFNRRHPERRRQRPRA